jgi:hypothetical protein
MITSMIASFLRPQVFFSLMWQALGIAQVNFSLGSVAPGTDSTGRLRALP